ncbi:DUF6183 family protein [Streptomyces sp. WAC05374]|uniref:DUF6183 family protein n=1 Tax=Streptomyces sp. WAC05374 TaxID=2487420 RepID=UPI0037DD6AE2
MAVVVSARRVSRSRARWTTWSTSKSFIPPFFPPEARKWTCYGHGWDIAIAALRPGGQEIAVLAATDAD